MKFEKMSYCAAIFGLAAVLILAPLGYAETSSEKTSIKEVKQEAQDFIQTLKSYSAGQRDEAVRKAKAVLENLDRRIDALETRIDNNWDNMNKATRKQARSSLRALRKQRTKVAEWYGSMQSSSADAWEHMKQGFSDAYKALYDAWENSVKEFSAEE
jgi:gas vesicle protein